MIMLFAGVARPAALLLSLDPDGTAFELRLGVGSPAQQISMVVDTGSEVTWLAGRRLAFAQDCQVFNQRDSSSFLSSGLRDSIQYEQEKVSGMIAQDFIEIGEYQVAMQFLLVDQEPSHDLCGLAGLNSNLQEPNIFDRLRQQNLIESGTFALSLTRGRERLYYGQLPERYWVGSAFVRTTSDYHWTMLAENVQVGGYKNDVEVLMDSGTTFIMLPSRAFKAALRGLASACYLQGEALLCERGSPLSMSFESNGLQFEIPVDQMMPDCEWYFEACQAFLGQYEGERVILGLPFFRVYDVTLDKVGRRMSFRGAEQAPTVGGQFVWWQVGCLLLGLTTVACNLAHHCRF